MKKLGFGTMRLPLIPGGKQTDIDFEQVKQMFDYFLEKGFTYVDTAYMYHDYTSEMAVRECLVKRHPRESFLLADKMPVASVETPADYPRIFAEQLEKTGAGYFDYYLLHDLTRNDIDIAENGGFGVWCEANDPENFTKAVDEMLTRDLNEMGEKGYKYLKENYTAKKASEIVLSHI